MLLIQQLCQNISKILTNAIKYISTSSHTITAQIKDRSRRQVEEPFHMQDGSLYDKS